MKVAVIGGGAAGMMFSTQYKKANPNDEVFVFEKSQYVAWAGCPTPYYIADELSFNDVVLGTPEDFIKRGVNVKILHKVTNIDFKNKNILILDDIITTGATLREIKSSILEQFEGDVNKKNIKIIVFCLAAAREIKVNRGEV